MRIFVKFRQFFGKYSLKSHLNSDLNSFNFTLLYLIPICFQN